MRHRNNVSARRSRPTTSSYRDAVTRIILAVQARHHLTDGELADRIGCSVGTVRNARNEVNNLDGVTLARFEHEFGPAAIDPFLELGGSRAVPLEVEADSSIHATVELSEVLHLLIAAQHPASAGGVEVTSDELRTILPQLLDARQALDVLIDRARFAERKEAAR